MTICLVYKKSRLEQSTKMRFMIAYSDTEGVPQRPRGTLWNLSVLFKHVVDESFNVIEDVLHVNHIVLDKQQTKKDIKRYLDIFMLTNDKIMKLHGCSQYYLCFWNASHDRAVLKHYDIQMNTIDLLSCARRFTNNKHKSYALGNLCKEYGLVSKHTHTAYVDSALMMNLVQDKLKIPVKEYVVISISPKKAKSSRHQTNEKTTSSLRWDGATTTKDNSTAAAADDPIARLSIEFANQLNIRNPAGTGCHARKIHHHDGTTH